MLDIFRRPIKVKVVGKLQVVEMIASRYEEHDVEAEREPVEQSGERTNEPVEGLRRVSYGEDDHAHFRSDPLALKQPCHSSVNEINGQPVSRKLLACVLDPVGHVCSEDRANVDYAGVRENPARDRVHVRLPREEREEPTPPTADQIEAVLLLMPRRHALAVLVLDATGMRVGELEERGLRCGDLDEPNTRWRIRRAVDKGRRGRWVSLPAELFAAVVATLPPREDRSPDQPVFPGLTQERLRTAIARACKASGTPAWSPHDLRHRRISLWHRQGETWALIGARVGQRSLSVTADTYTHVLLDDRELDHAGLVGQLNVAPS